MTDENVGVFPPDFTTLAGNVRLLVGDTDPEPMTDITDTTHGQYAWYSDAELEAFGLMYASNPKRVAIWILSIVPLNQAMMLKKWTTDDLAVDGPAIVKGMERTLARLADEVAFDVLNAGDNEGFFITEGEDALLDPFLWRYYYAPGVVVD